MCAGAGNLDGHVPEEPYQKCTMAEASLSMSSTPRTCIWLPGGGRFDAAAPVFAIVVFELIDR